MGEKKLYETLDKTELCTELKKIRSIYRSLAAKQKKFCSSFDIHCVEGCGHCCEHFIPDITPIEAEYLAFGLISEGLDTQVLEDIEKKRDDMKRCMFYKDAGPYHCTVYKWRPLICRLFGASASDNKEGRPVFRHCKWNKEGCSLTPEQLEAHKSVLVEMAQYGLRVDECRADETDRDLLPDALYRAIMKVRFMIELEEEQKKSDNPQ